MPLLGDNDKASSPQHLKSWEEKAHWARAKRDASLAKVKPVLQGVPEENDLPMNCQSLASAVLTSREIEITERYGILDLLSEMRTRRVSVEEVTRAFLRRAALAHAAVNVSSPIQK